MPGKAHNLSGSVKALLLRSELKVLSQLSHSLLLGLFQYLAYLQNIYFSCFLFCAYCVGCVVHFESKYRILTVFPGLGNVIIN